MQTSSWVSPGNMTRKANCQLLTRASDPAVQQEIETFFQAVDSYPANHARQPGLTFQEHLCAIIAGDSEMRAQLGAGTSHTKVAKHRRHGGTQSKATGI